MIITKKALPRRTFLRGAGVTLALPLLDAMVPALTALAQTAAKPVQRYGFYYLPNGVAMTHTDVNYWKPTTVGADFEFSPIWRSGPSASADRGERNCIAGRPSLGDETATHPQHRHMADRRHQTPRGRICGPAPQSTG